MKEIFNATSQNGRWGVAIVSETLSSVSSPVQATVTRVGETAGQTVYQAEITGKPQWLLVGGDLEPLAGASTVEHMSLQGNSSATLLLLSEEAIVRRWSYKRRGSDVYYYQRGERQPIPASVLLALALVPVSEAPEEIAPPPPFRVDEEHKGAIAQALIDAGYSAT